MHERGADDSEGELAEDRNFLRKKFGRGSFMVKTYFEQALPLFREAGYQKAHSSVSKVQLGHEKSMGLQGPQGTNTTKTWAFFACLAGKSSFVQLLLQIALSVKQRKTEVKGVEERTPKSLH